MAAKQNKKGERGEGEGGSERRRRKWERRLRKVDARGGEEWGINHDVVD